MPPIRRARLLERVRSGRATYPRTPRYTNRIHRDDVAGAILHFMGHPSPAPT